MHWTLGCENVAGKLRQEWQGREGMKFTKHGAYSFVATPYKIHV